VAATALLFAISATVLAAADATDPALRAANLWGYVLIAAYTAPIIVRRRHPVAALTVALAAGFAYAALSYPVALTPAVLLVIYSAAAALEPRAARLVLGAALVAAVVCATASPGPTDIGVPALVVLAWLFGKYVRRGRLATAALEEKNRELEQAQLDLARQAVTEERVRIARELHDVVAHSMSVVAVHAGTGRMVAATDPAGAERALATIETTTRAALQEMRRLLGVLRSDVDGGAVPGDLSPAPGLGDLDALVAEVVRSGVTVDVRVAGERRPLPPGLDLCAYRIVQEALTNVIKHAGPARAAVAIEQNEREVSVDVRDDGIGRAVAATAAAGTGGHGITGMRERVAMHGGTLDVGPTPGGGFRVHARLPIEAGA
jgi:signal transduction histidine kinase